MNNSSEIFKYLPIGSYEFVDIEFGAADTDLPIPYTLKANSPESIRFVDVTPNSVYNGSSDDVAQVYKSASPSRANSTSTHIFLRSTVANYATRLLLFLER